MRLGSITPNTSIIAAAHNIARGEHDELAIATETLTATVSAMAALERAGVNVDRLLLNGITNMVDTAGEVIRVLQQRVGRADNTPAASHNTPTTENVDVNEEEARPSVLVEQSTSASDSSPVLPRNEPSAAHKQLVPTPEELGALRALLQRDATASREVWCNLLTSAVGRLTQLTGLDLSGWPLSESVTNLRPLTRLRSLNVDNTSQSDFSLLGLLPVLGRLTKLSVAGNLPITKTLLAVVEASLCDLRVLNVKRNVLLEGPRGGLKQWMLRHPRLTVVRDNVSIML